MRHPPAIVFALLTFTACAAPSPENAREPVGEAPSALWSYEECEANRGTCAWALNGCGYGDEVCPSSATAYDRLLACAQRACGDDKACGPDLASGDGTADLLTQWNDNYYTAGTGLPDACWDCLAEACGEKLCVCEAATCSP